MTNLVLSIMPVILAAAEAAPVDPKAMAALGAGIAIGLGALGSSLAMGNLAGKALEDLQFLKQIKLLQIDDAYQTFYALQYKTLSGKIANFIDEYGGVTTMKDDYQKQMDAVTQMMVCPIGGTPFTIKSGTTMTIGKEMYDGVHYSYYGTLRNANGEIKGKIAEMDLLAAGGLNVEGKLVIDDDIYLPILMGRSSWETERSKLPEEILLSGTSTVI